MNDNAGKALNLFVVFANNLGQACFSPIFFQRESESESK